MARVARKSALDVLCRQPKHITVPTCTTSHPVHHHHQRRTFLPFFPGSSSSNSPSSSSSSSSSSSPFSSSPAPLKIQASRTLPYSREALFGLISDVSSYSHFVPFCLGATVHAHSSPDKLTGKRWPARATLEVGFAGHREHYESRVFCLPHFAVEAISGPPGVVETSLDQAKLSHYHDVESQTASNFGRNGGREEVSGSSKNELFTSLRAKWTLEPDEAATARSGRDATRVNLDIEAHWASVVLAMLSRSVADSVAEPIVGAFEKRAREVLGGGGDDDKRIEGA